MDIREITLDFLDNLCKYAEQNDLSLREAQNEAIAIINGIIPLGDKCGKDYSIYSSTIKLGYSVIDNKRIE